jgi:hypothetical protein
MWRLLTSCMIALFVTVPLLVGAVLMAIEVARGKAPPVDATTWPTVIVWCLLVLLSASGSWRLFALWRMKRAPRMETAGLWERFAKKHPRAFERAFSLNGFGLRYLDFHHRQPDGSGMMTLWLTVAFLPLAPIRRERVRALAPERLRGVPFVLWWRTSLLQCIERMPVDRSRNLRVYALYHGLFCPLVAAPPAAGLAYLVRRHFDVAAWQLWVALLVYLVWGICVVALERRVMGPPAEPS